MRNSIIYFASSGMRLVLSADEWSVIKPLGCEKVLCFDAWNE